MVDSAHIKILKESKDKVTYRTKMIIKGKKYTGVYHNYHNLGFLSAYELSRLKATLQYEVDVGDMTKKEADFYFVQIEKKKIKELQDFLVKFHRFKKGD